MNLLKPRCPQIAGVHLADMAKYLDDRRAVAVKEAKQLVPNAYLTVRFTRRNSASAPRPSNRKL